MAFGSEGADGKQRRRPTGATLFPDRIPAVIDRLREQVDDHWQIPRDEALVLAQRVRVGRCASLCEVGTYGFSTLYPAAAAHEHGGHVHTIEKDPRKVAAAASHRAAALDEFVTLHQGDARAVLARLGPATPWDIVFHGATTAECDAYLDAVWPRPGPRSVVVTDTTTTHAAEVASRQPLP